jgi:AcrR family transcriptional regulator
MNKLPKRFVEKMNETIDLTDQTNTKGKIFSAAAKLFAQKGYNGVSMRELSESTGLSKPTIYYYFGNKEGIYTALVEAGLHYGVEIFQKIVEQDIPIKDKIVQVVKVRFQQVLEYPDFAKFFLVVFTSSEKLPFLEDFIKESIERRKMLVDLIKEGIKRKEFGPSANPELAAEVFVGALMHFIMKQLNSRKVILSDKLAEDLVEFLFRGLNE